ncbi:2,5-dichloro-2,5-cyclohexadiene-1,4-diol dehydrogenase [Candidatus Phycosocius bacilliformis]|uniref:D-xylose 1-dehydrogenase n=1 Tax=Candidatus Phycosocius bacilliformis TaxID=1445552 RepID=A0A2P2EB24_9PROT|nr:SDR family oxidoreductase [Candidatus Phycosocius bacilliformis]GBF58243.1 2,5-dichloro-2,5-cyclohexadiene-1,4-diol dehydrogenase [Candidatus Phycosocius bacilliformis]
MTDRMSGKIIVVTGAASGIGLGTVERLIEEGAHVLAADIQDEKGAQLEARFKDRLIYRHCDVSDEQQVKAIMDEAAAHFGGLDGVFNNAGSAGVMSPLEEIGAADWKAIFDILVTSVFFGTKFATPHLARRGGGAIVNTASIAGLEAGWGPIAYSTAKAAVIHFSRVAAAELAAKNIRVNAICPGLIATSIFGTAIGLPRDQADQLAALIAHQGGNAQPIGRAGQPRDIAEAVLLMMSDAGSFITGTHLVVDGGITIGPRHAWDPASPSPMAAIFGDSLPTPAQS